MSPELQLAGQGEQSNDQDEATAAYGSGSSDMSLDVMEALAQPPPSTQAAPGVQPTDYYKDPDYLKEKEATSDAMRRQTEFLERELAEQNKGIADVANTPYPQMEKQPASPGNNLSQGAMEWMQIATLMGAMGGALTRGNSTVALTAFAGAIKGFTQGKEEEFKANMETWKAASQRIQMDNQAKLDAYNAIMKKKEWTMDQKMNMVKLVATQHQSEIDFHLAEQNRYVQFAQMMIKQEDWNKQFALNTRKVDIQADRTQAYVDSMKTFGGMRSPNGYAFMATVKEQEALAGHPLDAAQVRQIASDIQTAASRSRTMGGRIANIQIIEEELATSIPRALDASQAVKRSGFVMLNQLVQGGQMQTSDPHLQQFGIAALDVAEKWAKSMNPTGVNRQDLQDKALRFLSTATSPQAFAASLQQLQRQVDGVREGIQRAEKMGLDLTRTDGEEILKMRLDQAVKKPSKAQPKQAPATSNDDWGQLQVQ